VFQEKPPATRSKVNGPDTTKGPETPTALDTEVATKGSTFKGKGKAGEGGGSGEGNATIAGASDLDHDFEAQHGGNQSRPESVMSNLDEEMGYTSNGDYSEMEGEMGHDDDYLAEEDQEASKGDNGHMSNKMVLDDEVIGDRDVIESSSGQRSGR
jgi:hypothetical protein